MPALSQWFKDDKLLKDGTLKLNFAFMIPESAKGVISIEARDYSVKPPVSHFQAVITYQGFRIGTKSKAYQRNEWHQCEIIIPLNQSDKNILMTITQSDGKIAKTLVPSKSANKLSWLGIMLSHPKETHAFIDNLVISHENTKF